MKRGPERESEANRREIVFGKPGTTIVPCPEAHGDARRDVGVTSGVFGCLGGRRISSADDRRMEDVPRLLGRWRLERGARVGGLAVGAGGEAGQVDLDRLAIERLH